MDKLYLRDRAMREGWLNSKQFDDELKTINSSVENLRSEIGDDGYDALLYSMGRINRVKIRNVFQNSPAQVAGILTDDIVVSYANKRVFNWRDLSSASTQGQAGENTNIVINRDGQQLQFLIPRGPLGVQLYEYSEPPS
jgi:S1-C subfamily serine protease